MGRGWGVGRAPAPHRLARTACPGPHAAATVTLAGCFRLWAERVCRATTTAQQDGLSCGAEPPGGFHQRSCTVSSDVASTASAAA